MQFKRYHVPKPEITPFVFTVGRLMYTHFMPKPFSIAVLISGRGSNLSALIEHFRKDSVQNVDVRIAAVISDNSEAPGLEFAKRNNIPTVVVERRARERSNEDFNRELVAVLKPYAPDLVVLAGFMRIVHAEFIESFQGRVLNLHPSLLPAFPGAHAVAEALAAGVTQSGCTVHYVVEEVDSGPIVAQARVPIAADDTVESLAERIRAEEHKILPAAVHAIAQGDLALTDSKPRKIIWQHSVNSGPLKEFLASKPFI